MATTTNYNEVARQMKDDISDGQLRSLQKLLGPVIKPELIKHIEKRFMGLFKPKIDPVNFAINCSQEKIALYLVEKGFSLQHVYWEAEQGEQDRCDKWCYNDHGPDDCPGQVNASINAEKHKMDALRLRIDEIKQGKRTPGEGLSEPYIERFLPRQPPPLQQTPRLNKFDYEKLADNQTGEKTVADEAREILSKYGARFETRKKGSLLHLFIDRSPVFIYVLANCGVRVNIQDQDGDTALHLAVRKQNIRMVEALVQCSADISIRNKLGQTPVDEATGSIKVFLKKFDIGVVAAVREGSYSKLCKQLSRSWCNVEHVKVKDNLSLMELLQEKANIAVLIDTVKTSQRAQFKKDTDAAIKSLAVLNDYRPTSALIHAVLCEDADIAQKILEAKPDLKVNIRFRDRLGKTLLSHAVEANNLRLVLLLLKHDARVSQIRVREHEETDETIPLYMKALRRDIDLSILQALQSVLADKSEHEEKDKNGNTPLLRAIIEGRDVATIQYLLKVRGGYSLLDRNQEGLTALELATKLQRKDIFHCMEKFIMKLPSTTLRLFPVSFQFLQITDENKMTLEQKLSKTAEERHVKTSWTDYTQAEKHAMDLFTAAANGDTETIEKLCDANYQDRNGYTALTRAIVFNQFTAATVLCTLRPALKKMGDNSNRYPLHYVYALPDNQQTQFLPLLLDKDAAMIEHRMDKDGRVAAMYKDLRETQEIKQMLYDARTLDVYGKDRKPLGSWPAGAETFPPILPET